VPDDVRQRANIAVATIDAGTAGALKAIVDAAKSAPPPAAPAPSTAPAQQ